MHLAVRIHPSVTPARLVTALMNAAQQVVWQRFASDAIQARAERLFQPSAYIGSFGELATPQIEAYLENWRAGVHQRETPPDKPEASRGLGDAFV